jgi:hypothetical protein
MPRRRKGAPVAVVCIGCGNQYAVQAQARDWKQACPLWCVVFRSRGRKKAAQKFDGDLSTRPSRTAAELGMSNKIAVARMLAA